MAEVGLVRFAQVAREVAEPVLPTSRSKYSKHVFAQPSLWAILWLMRSEDWTSREAAGAPGGTASTARGVGLRAGAR